MSSADQDIWATATTWRVSAAPGRSRISAMGGTVSSAPKKSA
jgi:hypothetical protein